MSDRAEVPGSDRGPVVPVSLQWRGDLDRSGSRADRRQQLGEKLHDVLDRRSAVSVDWGTLSLSAQTVEGRITTERYEGVRSELEQEGLRVDRVVDQQVIQPIEG